MYRYILPSPNILQKNISYIFLPDPEVRDLLHCCPELLLSLNSAAGNFNYTERGERQKQTLFHSDLRFVAEASSY